VDTDRVLVEAAQAGDADAMDILVRRYQVRMFNFARTLTGADGDAEDLAQETFIRAFRGLGRFRGESSFKNWLYRIAVNVAHTHRKKRARQAPVWQRRLEADDVSERHLTDHTEDSEESVIHRQVLDRALSTLSEKMRAPLVLHDVEGLEYREIAEILDVPIGTIMSRIFRARQRMRPLLVDLLGPRDAIPANESEGSKEREERHRGRIVI
jgi:RNA polymerase sigma-70 factor (ECF subfamily)